MAKPCSWPRDRPRRGVRGAASDFALGEVLLDVGTLLTPLALVSAAAADTDTLQVHIRPRLAVLSTGGELVAPGRASACPGAIPDGVSFGIAALAQAWGGEVVCRRRLRDDLPSLAQAAALALEQAHVIVVTGKTSTGGRDFSKAMFREVGLRPGFPRRSQSNRKARVGRPGRQPHRRWPTRKPNRRHGHGAFVPGAPAGRHERPAHRPGPGLAHWRRSRLRWMPVATGTASIARKGAARMGCGC